MVERYPKAWVTLVTVVHYAIIPYFVYRAATIEASSALSWVAHFIYTAGAIGFMWLLVFDIFVLGSVKMTLGWYRYIRLCGLPRWNIVRAITSLDSTTQLRDREQQMYLFLGSVGLVSLVIGLASEVESLVAIGIASLLLIPWFVWYRALPPTVLFLATSSSRSLDLQQSMMEVAPWLRIVSLLYVREFHIRTDAPATVSVDVFRTRDVEDWRHTFRDLARMVPLIVVDARTLSSEVRFEIAWLQSSRYSYKCIVLSEKCSEDWAWRCVSSEDALVALVAHSTTKASRLPMPVGREAAEGTP